MNGHYDTAQICRNGHVINSHHQKYPAHSQQFCAECGTQTITQCESCKVTIRGSYVFHGPAVGPDYLSAPNYCHACGKPYPWTELKLQAAKELIDELEGFDAEERKILTQTLADLMTEGPKTEVASLRFKKLMKKVGSESYDAVKKVVTDLISETVKRSVFGP